VHFFRTKVETRPTILSGSVFVWLVLIVTGMTGALASADECRRAVTPQTASVALSSQHSVDAGDTRGSDVAVPPPAAVQHIAEVELEDCAAM
jgi:hypothetical protein